MEITSIGPYRVERQLSRGGLSRVYAATDTRTEGQVAIKVASLPSDPASRASFAELFRTETRVLASLRHPALTAILDQGVMVDGTPYFVMEYVHGQDLGKVLDAQGRLPVEAALRVARQVAGGLGAAHAKGYLHRDVKPENILVLAGEGVAPWTVKLLDFGVTERVDDRTRLTRGGDYFGSVRYMSPEQVRAQPLSAGSDVWGLGVTLYEMLVGQPPFSGQGMAAAMAAIMTAEVTIPPEVVLPEAVGAFLRRCLAKEVAMRPADGQEAEREITRLEAGAVGSMAEPPPPRMGEYRRTRLQEVSVAELPPSSRAAAPFPMDAAVRATGASRTRGVGIAVWVGLSTVAAVVTGVLVYLLVMHRAAVAPGLPGGPPVARGGSSHAWSGVLVGVGLALGGVLIGNWVRRMLAGKTSAISSRAHEVLSGARSRDELSRTMAIQVDDIAAQCRLADERFLATTMAVMVDEYGASTTFDDRQKALMNAVALLEKLNAKLSPWYVRYDKLIALGVTLVGVVSGLVTIVQNVAKLIKGS